MDHLDPTSPLHCVCFNIRRIARRITQSYDHALKPAGLQATQFTLLAMLGASEDALATTALARRLGMDRTTLTRNLAITQRNGWTRSLNSEDGRERLIRLTAAGKRKLHAAMPLWRKVQEETVDNIGRQQFANLLALRVNIENH